MTLKQWFENSWLRQHKTKPSEISDLLQIVDRDLKDARERHISNDWRFGIAYNAALKLCTILLYAERPLNFKKNGQSGPSGKNLTKIVTKFQFPTRVRFPHFSPI